MLQGEIDVASVVGLRTAVDELARPPDRHHRSTSAGVTFMDSTGLGWLAALAEGGCAVDAPRDTRRRSGSCSTSLASAPSSASSSPTPEPDRRSSSGHVDRHHRRPPCPRRHGRRVPGQAGRPRRGPRPARGADRGAARRSGRRSRASGWLGLHLPEEHGGSGYGLEELVVVVEELGRAVAPGPFVPTVIASAILAAAGDDATKAALLPGLADGSHVRRRRPRRRRHGQRTARPPARPASCSAAGSPTCCSSPVGDDVAVVEVGDGVTVEVPAEPRPHPPLRPRHPRRRAGHGAPRRARRRSSTSPA